MNQFTNPLKKEVLNSFKNLHKARKLVFAEDDYALKSARLAINIEYNKYKSEKDINRIDELIKLSNSVAKELKETVIQAKEKKPGQFEIILREDNIKYQDELPKGPVKRCSD